MKTKRVILSQHTFSCLELDITEQEELEAGSLEAAAIRKETETCVPKDWDAYQSKISVDLVREDDDGSNEPIVFTQLFPTHN